MKKRLRQYIDSSEKLKRWETILRNFTLPGFGKIPVWEVLKFLLEEIRKDQLPTRARSIAYSFFIAFFPGIIFLFTLLPYIPLEGFQEQMLTFLNSVIPDEVYRDFIEFVINDLLNKPREGLLSLGAVLTLYFATQGVVSMILSFNKTHSIYNDRNFFQMRWTALKLTVLLIILFIVSIGLIITGGFIIEYIVLVFQIKSHFTILLFNTLRYIIIILLFFLSISAIYYYGPSAKKKFQFISPGSTFATIVSIAASVGFSYYVSSIDRYDNIYGIFGSIIIFLTWLYVNAFVLLIGFELNASIYYKQSVDALSEKDLELNQ